MFRIAVIFPIVLQFTLISNITTSHAKNDIESFECKMLGHPFHVLLTAVAKRAWNKNTQSWHYRFVNIGLRWIGQNSPVDQRNVSLNIKKISFVLEWRESAKTERWAETIVTGPEEFFPEPFFQGTPSDVRVPKLAVDKGTRNTPGRYGGSIEAIIEPVIVGGYPGNYIYKTSEGVACR